jgi:hypothetical protein
MQKVTKKRHSGPRPGLKFESIGAAANADFIAPLFIDSATQDRSAPKSSRFLNQPEGIPQCTTQVQRLHSRHSRCPMKQHGGAEETTRHKQINIQ